MTTSDTFDTVVIGGGIAGLYAAYLLQETHNQNVLVLEAKDRIGGRLYAANIKCAKGTDRWDLGGQWVGETQVRLIKVLSEFNIEMYDQFTTGKKKLVVRDLSDIRSYSGLIPSLGPLELLEIDSMIKQVDKLCETIDLEKIATHPNAVEWDSVTLHTFMNEHCRFQSTKEMMETAIRVVFGVDLANITLLFFLYYCKQGGSFETLLDVKNGGAQGFRIKGTMYSLCEKIAKELKNVLIGEPVSLIDQTDAENISVVTKAGNAYKCQNVIMAIAPHLVNNVEFVPSLPSDRIRLGEAMPPAHYIKFVATYSKAFWKDKGMSGEVTCTTLPCATGPVTVTFDATTSQGNPAVVGFICAEHAIYWTTKTMAERRVAVLDTLAATLGNEALDIIDYVDKDWSNEPYNGGCPVNVMRPRTLLYYHHALKQPYGRIHWAGTETARVWTGYIDGAIESSLRSVLEIVNGKSLPVTEWMISPAFQHHLKFNSDLEKKSSAFKWRFAKIALVGAIAVGCISYVISVGYLAKDQ